MNKKLASTLVTLIISAFAFGQNYVYKGDKQFIATQNWSFKLANYSWHTDGLGITVAKNSTGGYIMLSIEVPFNESISGAIFMILENGKSINLTTKVVSDHVDNKSQVLYTITQAQLVQLKTYSISKIRFSLKNPKGVIGGLTGSFTATNQISEYKYGNEINTWNTAKEISELYDEEE